MLLKSVREYKKSSILSFVAFGLQACSDCTIPLLMGFMINEMNDFQTMVEMIHRQLCAML